MSGGMHYLHPNFKKLRPGMIVVHNHILHTREMPLGMNGFRAWQQKPAKDRVRCRCGWWGIEHYRVRGTGASAARCVTWAQLAKVHGNPIFAEIGRTLKEAART
jgi:hypothetical protein